MKRTGKYVFFIIALLILAFAFTTFVGVSQYYGDRKDIIITGASDIRFGIDIKGGVDAVFGPVDVDALEEKYSENEIKTMIENVKGVIEQRMIAQGITDYEAFEDIANRQVIIRFPWKSDEEDFDAATAVNELGKTAMLEFRMGNETETKTDDDDNEIIVPSGEIIFTGELVANASANYVTADNGSYEPVVSLELEDEGAEAFADATAEALASGTTISIWLDNEMISDAKVQQVISDGKAIINGIGSSKRASTLANLINSGALPFALEVKGNSEISPSLGASSLNIMVWSGLIAFCLIAVFMVAYYRLPGAVAVISLIGQVAGSIAAVSGYFSFMSGFTLTLPGIAGIILSIGMGVDANIITSERIKEEIRAGKTIDGAVRAGSENSFSAIFDGNITVMIVAIILMGVFGPPSSIWAKLLSPILGFFAVSTTGAIYSFGYTLFAGIVFNFIMGVTASRFMLKSLVSFEGLRKPWLLGGEKHAK